MADLVTVISSSIVRPRNINYSGPARIHLTPFDLTNLHIDYPQRGLLFPKPNSEIHFVSRLKTSLSNALEIYFPFAGRLVKVENLEDNTMAFHIDCEDGFGAKFVHAESKCLSMSDILQPSVPHFMNHLFPVGCVKCSDGVSEPLLAIQVTEMKDGVFISFCYNHIVADGVSMWDFFHTWSKICSNGSDSDHRPLVLKEWFLDGIDYPIHIPIPETKKPSPSRAELPSAPITKDMIFHFTKKNISDLKTKANNEVDSSDLKISSLQAVSAHMWRSIIRHSGLNGEVETHCKVAVDLRQRLDPPLQKECFGNIAYLTPAISTVEELLDCSLGWAALQISKLVKWQTNENCKTFAEDWVTNVKNPRSGVRSRIAGSTVVVSSSPRFEVYENDFGWGKPIAARAGPGNDINGKLVIFPGHDEGSIDIQATLWFDVLVHILTDVEFLENVTI